MRGHPGSLPLCEPDDAPGFPHQDRATTHRLAAAHVRAGHAHAGVLILMALLYQSSVRRTGYAEGTRVAWSLLLITGNLMQSGGFFVHMLAGAPGRPSWGTRLTYSGAIVLTVATGGLVVGLGRTQGNRIGVRTDRARRTAWT